MPKLCELKIPSRVSLIQTLLEISWEWYLELKGLKIFLYFRFNSKLSFLFQFTTFFFFFFFYFNEMCNLSKHKTPSWAAGITCELLCKWYEGINRQMILSLWENIRWNLKCISFQFSLTFKIWTDFKLLENRAPCVAIALNFLINLLFDACSQEYLLVTLPPSQCSIDILTPWELDLWCVKMS